MRIRQRDEPQPADFGDQRLPRELRTLDGVLQHILGSLPEFRRRVLAGAGKDATRRVKRGAS